MNNHPIEHYVPSEYYMNIIYMIKQNSFITFLPAVISISILFHHRYIHRNDTDLSHVQKWMQKKDINNHETWQLVFWGVFVGILMSHTIHTSGVLRTQWKFLLSLSLIVFLSIPIMIFVIS